MPDLNIATHIATATPTEIARAAERRVAQRDQHREQPDRDAQRHERDVRRVDDRDHDQRARSSTTESVSRNTRIRVAVRGVSSASAAERERGVGRHRRAPPVRARAAGVERQVDHDRHR